MKSYLYIATSSSSRFKDWQTNCSPQQRLIKSRLWNVHQELFYLERCSLNKGFEKSCIINTIRHIWKNYIATGSVCLEHFYFIFFYYYSLVLTKDAGLRLWFALLKRKVQQPAQFLERILPACFHSVWRNSLQEEIKTPGQLNCFAWPCQPVSSFVPMCLAVSWTRNTCSQLSCDH